MDLIISYVSYVQKRTLIYILADGAGPDLAFSIKSQICFDIKTLQSNIKYTTPSHSTNLTAVWLSGNMLASINVVVLRRTRLVPGWVTICGRVNHLSM